MQKFNCFEIVHVSIIFLSLFCLYLVVFKLVFCNFDNFESSLLSFFIHFQLYLSRETCSFKIIYCPGMFFLLLFYFFKLIGGRRV